MWVGVWSGEGAGVGIPFRLGCCRSEYKGVI